MNKKGKESPYFIDRTGEFHTTNEGYLIEIVKYNGLLDCTIRFESGLEIKEQKYLDVKNGWIRYPFHPSVNGVGYIGVGKYLTTIKGKKTKEYERWKTILDKCYNEKQQEKQPYYKGCSVYSKWHNFQIFAQWYNENYQESRRNYHIDKDILVKGNKIYSPETCCFVPTQINSLFTKSEKRRGEYPIGVSKRKLRYAAILNKKFLASFITPEEAFECYKFHKEIWIKKIANEWKDRIDIEVYQAMHRWIVEITG